jgi:nitroreductase
MDVVDAIRKRRSIRRFQQEKIPRDELKRMVEAARLAPSGANMQPLKYLVIDDDDLLDKVFSTLSWAVFLGEEGAPPEGRRPVAYIIVLADTSIKKERFHHDSGMAVENILIYATSRGIGSCCIGAVDRPKLREVLGLPERFIIDLVVALGYPAEESVAEEMVDSTRYWKDENGRVHVPKRRLEDILYWNKV